MITTEYTEIDNVAKLTISNDYISVKVTNIGCAIMEVLMPSNNGKIDNVVLGYDSPNDYLSCNVYLGVVVGRVTNRIENGRFELNSKEYTLAINNGPNHLHGGLHGFNSKIFDYQVIDDYTLQFHYLSKDSEEGYPGDLDVVITYTLKDNTLEIDYKCISTKDTIVNLTNHSYFNLGNTNTIHEHLLYVASDSFHEIDQNGLTINKICNVQGTPFDFRVPKKIGKDIEVENIQLQYARGYDHSFILNKDSNQISLLDNDSGRKLTVSTTMPHVHVYSGNYLDDTIGAQGTIYNNRYGIALETQYLPNSINIEDNPMVILKAGELYNEGTSYTFEVIK